jgi:hypothetical protein
MVPRPNLSFAVGKSSRACLNHPQQPDTTLITGQVSGYAQHHGVKAAYDLPRRGTRDPFCFHRDRQLATIVWIGVRNTCGLLRPRRKQRVTLTDRQPIVIGTHQRRVGRGHEERSENFRI